MKKFIKALESSGIMENIVRSAIMTEKLTGMPVGQSGVEMVLEEHMSEDEDLEDVFLQEAHEIAMKSVFEHVQKQIEEQKKLEVMNVDKLKDKEIEAIIEAIAKKFIDEAFDILKNMIDDCK